MKQGFLLMMLLCGFTRAVAQNVYEVKSGTVSFHSDAPKELISAASQNLRGIIDANGKTFAFKIDIISFMGFNSPLQREHFNENYMESSRFPEASFSGKIIEDVDFTKEGEYTVRAKGKLIIHGVEQERIIRSVIISENGIMKISSNFTVVLADYNIKIPKVVNNKLAPEISVSINALLLPKT